MRDVWSKLVPSILAAETVDRLRAIADNESALIVEHRHYRGSKAPTRLVFDGADELEAYLRTEGRPGDSFWIWRYDECCRDDNPLTHGKVPNADGDTPEGGAY